MKRSLFILLILITGLSCSSGKHEEARESKTRFLIEEWHRLFERQIWAGEGIPIGGSIEVLQELSRKHKMYDKDLWGQKFIYSYDGRPETFHFYSSGPNGIDEGGRGDDIVQESETRFVREALSIMEKRMERGPDARQRSQIEMGSRLCASPRGEGDEIMQRGLGFAETTLLLLYKRIHGWRQPFMRLRS